MTCGLSSRANSWRLWLISFSSVVKRYPGGQEGLKGVSFAIEAGQFAFVAGHSGAGKSTLLKLIPAIERPSGGAVLVNGQNVGALKRAALPYLRRNLGIVFQDQKLLYDRSVYDNVMLPLAFSRWCGCAPALRYPECRASAYRRPSAYRGLRTQGLSWRTPDQWTG